MTGSSNSGNNIIMVCLLISLCMISGVSGASEVVDLPIPNQLRDDTTFQGYDTVLTRDGYEVSTFTIGLTPDQTKVTINYTDDNGKEAVLTAEMTGDKVTKVTLDKEEEPLWPLFLLLVIVVLCIIGGYYLYSRYHAPVISNELIITEEICDPRAKAEELLLQAEEARDQGHLKTAYGLAGRALRVYISEQYGTGTEETNMEIIRVSNETGKNTDTIKNILDTTSLVEFAKRNGDSDELSSVVSVIRGLI